MTRDRITWGIIGALALLAASTAGAGIVVYEEADKKIEIGGQIQLQYADSDPDGGTSTDTIFFRRLRPHISGTVTENWYGKIQFDFGKVGNDDEVEVKDAYMQYTGFKAKNLKLSIGNTKTTFSREFLTSSSRQQFVERTFSGDHNYGVPDRQLGLRLDGKSASKKLTYGATIGSESHDPDVTKIDFDSPASAKSDWNEGYVVAGRLDFHPLGEVKFAQGDFDTEAWKYTIGAGVFSWSNDDDNNSFTDPLTGLTTSTTKVDLDSADGIELSGALRGRGLSIDAAFQSVEAETVDPTFTGGVFLAGSTELEKVTVEAGYMFGGNLELAVGYETQDADTYATEWERTSFGLNWFWNKHNAKLQLTHGMGRDLDGVDGADEDTTYLMTQFIF